MWIRVATDKSSVQYRSPINLSFINGENIKEFYFDKEAAYALEEDGFLNEMWDKLDALFDWGDCDFFEPEKCVYLREWLLNKLANNLDERIIPIYKTMLEYTDIAIKYDTGISFDF